MGREYHKYGYVSCALGRDNYENLKSLAERENVSISTFIRSIICDALTDEGFNVEYRRNKNRKYYPSTVSRKPTIKQSS
jgi:hypothetical protein